MKINKCLQIIIYSLDRLCQSEHLGVVFGENIEVSIPQTRKQN